MNDIRFRFSNLKVGLALAFGLALGLGSALAHPNHSATPGAPWYRYLPPGAPLPTAPVNP